MNSVDEKLAHLHMPMVNGSSPAWNVIFLRPSTCEEDAQFFVEDFHTKNKGTNLLTYESQALPHNFSRGEFCVRVG